MRTEKPGNLVRRLRRSLHRAAAAMLLLAQAIILGACVSPAPAGFEDPGVVLSGTAGKTTPAASPTAFMPGSAEDKPLAVHEGALRFVSYNVQFGAGYTRRLDRVMEVLHAHQPDILALQELNRWGVGNPSRIALVAQELGLQFVFCDSNSMVGEDPDDSFDTALLTRLAIVDAEAYPQVPHCMVRAKLQLPNGSLVQVLNLHFRPDFAQSGCSGPEQALQIAAPYLDQNAILLGDFNLPGPSGASGDFLPVQEACARDIASAGWVFIAQNVIEIDQFWVSPALQGHKFQAYPGPHQDPLFSYQDLVRASDHFPLVMDIVFP